MEWNFEDYRMLIREWMDIIQPDFLNFLTPASAATIQWFAQSFPTMYNYFFAWGAAISFAHLTGYGRRKEDKLGGGMYIPKCDMLKVAREEYGIEKGDRICTHVCKIFSEEFMRRKGIPVVFEPNFKDGSCMMRTGYPKSTCCSDHELYEW